MLCNAEFSALTTIGVASRVGRPTQATLSECGVARFRFEEGALSISVRSYWSSFDSLMRGEVPAADRLRLIRTWLCLQVICAALFGIGIGCFSLTSREFIDTRFLLTNTVKMPLLLLGTTLITCPSLYVFGALRGLRFSAAEFVATLIAAHTVLAGILASFSPVVAFFGLTTRTYSFMVLLTVAVCSLGAVLGLLAFIRALQEKLPQRGAAEHVVPKAWEAVTDDDLKETPDEQGEPIVQGPAPLGASFRRTEAERSSASSAQGSPDHAERRQLWQVLGWWLLLYAVVGVQMSWILRPFIGSPSLEFVFFRGKSGSFVEAVFDHLGRFFGG